MHSDYFSSSMLVKPVKTLSKRCCPVCSACQAELLHCIRYPDASDRILPTEYRIVGCSQCGMVYDDFDADSLIFAQHYVASGKYIMEGSGGAGGNSAADVVRFKQIIASIMPYIQNKNLSIVDIGCGKGGLLKQLVDLGYRNLHAVDASPECVRYINEHYPFEATCAELGTYEPGSRFDLIICSQVMEHLFDPRPALESIRRMLKPGGVFYCDVPDASRHLEYTKAPLYFFDQEHINHFYPATMRKLLETAGFQVQQMEMLETCPVTAFPCPNLAVISINSPISVISNYPIDFSPTIRYLEESLAREASLKNLQGVKGEGYLWGVGAYCLRLLEEGAFWGVDIIGLIDLDKKKQGSEILGLQVFAPEVLKGSKEAEVFVIITSVLYQHQIRKMLSELGFTGRIFVL